MTDRSRSRRRNGGAQEGAHVAHATNTAATHKNERRDDTFQNVIERWSFDVAKEGLNQELGTTNAVLRGALAIRDMQIDAAKRTHQTHEQAGKRVESARTLAELTSVGLMIAQADAEGAVRYWTEMAGIVARSSFETWNEAFGAFTRMQSVAATLGQHWLEAASAARPETLEAEVQHVTTPLTSSPFVWPAQEAVREAMTLGAKNWNDWLGSTVPAMAQALEAAAAPTRH